MATTTLLVNGATNSLADTPEIIYTSPEKGGGTIIKALTASNNSTSNKYYRAYIVDGGKEPINAQIKYRIVIWGEMDAGTGVDGQVIPPGGSLYVECNEPESIYFTISGRETRLA